RDRFVERQARGWVERRVVDQPSEECPARVVGHQLSLRTRATTGMRRPAFTWYSAKCGHLAVCSAQTLSRSSPSSEVAVASNLSDPTSTVTRGRAIRFLNQSGSSSDPPLEA